MKNIALDDSFLVLSDTKTDKKPDDIWVIGYSDPQEKYEIFYYDQRGVSSIFNVTFDGKKLVCSSNDKDFYQLMTLTVNANGLHTIAEASEDKGKTWREHLEMAYKKVKSK